jgi:hypothetical protein
MTALTIVSAYTVIPQGRVDLGEVSLDETTVRDVKRMIHGRMFDDVPTSSSAPCSCEDDQRSDGDVEKYMLWWRGYRLDADDLSLIQACVGVSEGEALDCDRTESLVLFLTVPLERSHSNGSSSGSGGALSPRLVRSFSDLMTSVRQELTPTPASVKKPGQSWTGGCNIV